MRRIVAKFGGSSLENGNLVRKAAKSVKKELEKGDTEIAVVVSAMGGTTDTLVEAAKEGTKGEVSKRALDSIMATGEKVSARIFASTLQSLGVEARPITPEGSEWPIITDSQPGNATPDLNQCDLLAGQKIGDLLEEGVVPVICGFLGKDEEGRITTLGRGGSDITALLVSKCIDASEVVLVTDAEGVMSADPRKVEDPEILERVTAEEICDLARYGSKIIHHNALKYKNPETSARVIHFQHGNLSAEGTTIEGSTPETEDAKIELYSEPLSMLTVVGEEMQDTPGVLINALNPLSNSEINIFGVSIGPQSFSLYVNEEESQDALDIIHQSVKESDVMKSTTSEEGIAMVVTESERFIDTPGIIADLSDPLAEEGINVVEIYSSQTSISFFVNWEERERAFELLKETFQEEI